MQLLHLVGCCQCYGGICRNNTDNINTGTLVPDM